MSILIALFLPFLTFFHLQQSLHGWIALVLQMTVIGWIPASIWALITLHKAGGPGNETPDDAKPDQTAPGK